MANILVSKSNKNKQTKKPLKKAQASLIIIIGILLLVFIAFITLRQKNKVMFEASSSLSLENARANFNNIIESCMESTVREAIIDSGLKKGISESLIKESIIKAFPDCISSSELFKRENIVKKGSINATVNISESQVIVNLDYPMTISLPEGKSEINFKNKKYVFKRKAMSKIFENKKTIITSPEKNFKITIPEGSIAGKEKYAGIELLDREFKGLENKVVMGMLAYEALPKGAEFAKPVELTIYYNDEDIPSTVDEKSLNIGYYDEKSGLWYALPTEVDPKNNKLSAKTTHFTPFAVVIMCSEDLQIKQSYIPIPIEQQDKKDVEISFFGEGNSCVWKSSEENKDVVVDVVDSQDSSENNDADIIIEAVCPEGEQCLIKNPAIENSVLKYTYFVTNGKNEIRQDQGTNIKLKGFGINNKESYYSCTEGSSPRIMPVFGGNPLVLIESECICKEQGSKKTCIWVAKEGAEPIIGESINMEKRDNLEKEGIASNLENLPECDEFKEKYKGSVIKTSKSLDTRSRDFEDIYGDYPEMQYKDWLSFSADTELVVFDSKIYKDRCWLLVEAQDKVTKDGVTWNVDFWIKLDQLDESDFVSTLNNEGAGSENNNNNNNGNENTGSQNSQENNENNNLLDSCTYCGKNLDAYTHYNQGKSCDEECCVGKCPENTLLLNVPYHSQCDYDINYNNYNMCRDGCGVAVTEMGLEYFNADPEIRDVESLFKKYIDTTNPEGNNQLISTMYQYARQHGYSAQEAMSLNNDEEWFKEEINKNHPVIVTATLDKISDEACYDFDKGGHFLLVVGYSDDYFIVHDPNPENKCKKKEYGKNLVISKQAFSTFSSSYSGSLKQP